MIAKLRKAVASTLGAALAVVTFGLFEIDRSGNTGAAEGCDPHPPAELTEPLALTMEATPGRTRPHVGPAAR